MKKSFPIQYKNQEVVVERLTGDHHGNEYYVAHIPGEDITLEYTEDDEGAGHWLEKKSNHETDVSKAIGQLIELYHMQHSEKD